MYEDWLVGVLHVLVCFPYVYVCVSVYNNSPNKNKSGNISDKNKHRTQNKDRHKGSFGAPGQTGPLGTPV